MSFLSSKTVKKTLREKIYQKLLRLGASYKEQVKTSEVVQVAVEGTDQLETYFGAYLPQFFYIVCESLTFSYEVDREAPCGHTSVPSGNYREILHSVDLTFPRGAFTSIVGESGCGKSTSPRLLLF